jgi:hypothetical protein
MRPGEERSPKTTQLSGREVPPTMLAKGEPAELPADEGAADEDETPTAQLKVESSGRPGSVPQINLGDYVPPGPAPTGSSGIELDADLPVAVGDSSSEVDLSALPKHSSRREKGAPDSGSFAEVASSDLLVEPSPSSEALNLLHEGDVHPPSTPEEILGHEERAADALEEAETVHAEAGGSGVLAEAEAGEAPAAEAKPKKRAARAEAEEEAAGKPAKRGGGGILGWVGGGVIGAVVAAAACVGLWLMDMVPSKEGEKKPPANAPQDGGRQQAGKKTEPETPEKQAARLLAFPDVKGARTSLEEYKGKDPETLTQRAELRWLEYLGETKGQPKADAEAVQKAKQDLKDINSARATYLLGQIEEDTGKVGEAKEIYRKAMQTYPDDKEIFQGALDHLNSRRAAKKAAEGGALAPRPGLDREAEARLVVLLIALQGAPAEKGTPEAGPKFWEALRLANQDGNYAEAIKALDEAVQRHNERRFTNLRRGLNPVSDPKEEIFLRSAEELKAYWQLLAALKAGKIDTGDPVKAFEKLAGEKKAAEKNLEDVAAVLVDAKIIPKDEKVDPKAVQKGVEAIATARKDAEDGKKLADDALAAAFKLLAKEKFVPDDEAPAKAVPAGITKALDAKKACDTKLQDVGKQLAEAGIKDADAAKGIERLAGLKKDFEDVAKKLTPQFLNQQKTDVLNPADRKAVLGGVDKVIEAVPLTVREAMAQVTELQNRLKQAHTSQQMIDLWAPLLQHDRSNKEVATEAARDGKAVAEDPKASPELKAKAHYVEGLALRNEGKFEAARKALADAVAGGAKAAWQSSASRALAELVDPSAYYLPHSQALLARGESAQALALVNEGLSEELFPNNGRLLALRSLVRLEQAREQAKGQRLTDATPGLKEARADAQQALQASKDAAVLADAHYALGRINEELGKWDDAQTEFDTALDVLKKEKPSAQRNAAQGRCEVAKARTLLRLRQGVPATSQESKPAPATPPRSDKAARAPALPSPFLLASNTLPVKHQLLLTTDCGPVCDVPQFFFPAPWVRQLPTTGPELKRDGLSSAEIQRRANESLRLAEAAIQDGDNEGYLLKAQALAAKDDWTQALQIYVQGLHELVRAPRYPARYVADLNGLKYLVENNPALLAPGAALPPDREAVPDEVIATSQAAEALGGRLIAAGNPQGYLIQGMALAHRGQWKDGLRTYVTGLQERLKPAAYGNGLRYLVDHHPAFQRPDGMVPPNPEKARFHFAKGLDRYWDGDYAGAESQLLEAIHQNDQDARFYYYLGLSRLPQAGKRAYALDDFHMAGLLERRNRPGTAAVGLALERVQGPARTLLNERASRLPSRRP